MTAPAAPFSAERTAAPSLRALLRLGGLAAWTGCAALVWGTGSIIGGRWRWTLRCRALWARASLRILGVRATVHGTCPGSGYLLATNHLSYLDVLLLSATLPVRFVAKQEVRGWPVWGPLAAWTGTLFIDRERPRDARRVADRLAAVLSAGQAAVIFAEGTSSPGDDVRPYRPALFAAAIQSGCRVVPARMQYLVPDRPGAEREMVCWWGEMEFGPHLFGLAELPRIDAHLTIGAPLLPGDDRRELARRAHRATTDLLHLHPREDGPTC